MNPPHLSNYLQARQPSSVRVAQLEFAKRTDGIKAIDVAIGNVSLPMYPLMIERLNRLSSFFKNGVVKYTSTIGLKEANQAVLNIIGHLGVNTNNIYSQITDGGSSAMELAIIGVCDPGKEQRPLLLIEPIYPNYLALAKRTGRNTVTITRTLQENGQFTLPNFNEIEQKVLETNPTALVIIPYDNPTGQFFNHQTIIQLAKLCVKHNLWMISDEAYRELVYTAEPTSSIWKITEQEVPGITSRKISIESASKVWNACGIRVGALVTDNKQFHEQELAEYTSNLAAPALGQCLFGALANESKENLHKWYEQQRAYYKNDLKQIAKMLKSLSPELIVSSPDAAIYFVVDVRKIDPNFDSKDFVLYCSRTGKLNLDGEEATLLVAPMNGFYSAKEKNPGKTQMRIAYVQSPEQMRKVPELFVSLLKKYLDQKEPKKSKYF